MQFAHGGCALGLAGWLAFEYQRSFQTSMHLDLETITDVIRVYCSENETTSPPFVNTIQLVPSESSRTSAHGPILRQQGRAELIESRHCMLPGFDVDGSSMVKM